MRDQEMMMSVAQAITATAVSQNTYDQGGAVDAGAGEPLYYEVRSVQQFNTLTSLTIELITSASENLGTPTVIQSTSVPLAGLTANTVLVRSMIPPGKRLRYLGFRYAVVGTNPTQGTIEATLARRELPSSFLNAVA
jgi:hypothetical protein